MASLARPLVFAALMIANVVLNVTFADFAPIDQGVVSSRFFTDRNPLVLADPGLADLKQRMSRGVLVPRPGEQFVLSSTYGDEVAYLRMAMGEPAPAPYRFRPAIPALVRGMTAVYGGAAGPPSSRADAYRRAATGFWILNAAFLALGAIAVAMLGRKLRTEPIVTLAATMGFCTQFGVLQTAAYPMLDVASYALVAWVVYAIVANDDLMAIALVGMAPVVRDALIMLGPAAALYAFSSSRRRLFLGVALGGLVFVAVRLAQGASAMNVQYDWDVAQGKFSFVYARAHLIGAPASQLVATATAFGVLWLYAPFAGVLRSVKLLWPALLFLGLVLVAQILLSSRIVRVLAIAYPMFLLVPMLLFREQQHAPSAPS
jgi:hypothetical protein